LLRGFLGQQVQAAVGNSYMFAQEDILIGLSKRRYEFAKRSALIHHNEFLCFTDLFILFIGPVGQVKLHTIIIREQGKMDITG